MARSTAALCSAVKWALQSPTTPFRITPESGLALSAPRAARIVSNCSSDATRASSASPSGAVPRNASASSAAPAGPPPCPRSTARASCPRAVIEPVEARHVVEPAPEGERARLFYEPAERPLPPVR
eukprot:CAMPEP_0183801348 /NCGR_PEP_ID=MMETSP0803_2-20130417/27514_1 /TAXON_ID=195967 /ORGANISM="Crustomastix stigmata, Strain CCMP3273" /LENGTH=125 /DNA_ID=CAMNT_0026046067 /DNA_START=58 /DNA_END=434 /DNA_ORIENTATION=+